MKIPYTIPLSLFASTDIKRLGDIDRILNSILKNRIACAENSHIGIAEGDLFLGGISPPEHTKYYRYIIDVYGSYRKYAKSRHPEKELFNRDWSIALRRYFEQYQYVSLLDFYFLCLMHYFLGDVSQVHKIGLESFEKMLSVFSASFSHSRISRYFERWVPFWKAFDLYLTGKYNGARPQQYNEYYFTHLQIDVLSEIYFWGNFPHFPSLKSDVIQCSKMSIEYIQSYISRTTNRDTSRDTPQDAHYIESELNESQKFLSIYQELFNFANTYQ